MIAFVVTLCDSCTEVIQNPLNNVTATLRAPGRHRCAVCRLRQEVKDAAGTGQYGIWSRPAVHQTDEVLFKIKRAAAPVAHSRSRSSLIRAVWSGRVVLATGVADSPSVREGPVQVSRVWAGLP